MLTGDYPPLWVRRKHAVGCDGTLARLREVVTVDCLGRRGNGGIVAHLYVCNRQWAGCEARVLVAERTLRMLAAEAVGEVG